MYEVIIKPRAEKEKKKKIDTIKIKKSTNLLLIASPNSLTK